VKPDPRNIIIIIIMNNIKNIKILDSINRELYITYYNNIFLKVKSL